MKSNIVLFIILLFNVSTVYYVYRIHPSDSESIYLIYFVPVAFFVNIVIGSILVMCKLKYGIYFFINSIVNSLVVLISFIYIVRYYQQHDLKTKLFTIDNVDYSISFNNKESTFFIYNREKGQFSMERKFTVLKRSDKHIKLMGGGYNDVYVKSDSIHNFPKMDKKAFLGNIYKD